MRAAGATAGGQHTSLFHALRSMCTAPGQPEGPGQLSPADQSLLLCTVMRACALCVGRGGAVAPTAAAATFDTLTQLCVATAAGCAGAPWLEVDAAAIKDAARQAAECGCAPMVRPLVCAGVELVVMGGDLVMEATKQGRASFVEEMVGGFGGAWHGWRCGWWPSCLIVALHQVCECGRCPASAPHAVPSVPTPAACAPMATPLPAAR